MERGRSLANTELASSPKNLDLPRRSRCINLNSFSRSNATSALPVKSSKPRNLVSLCLGFLGEDFDDQITGISEAADGFPHHFKLAVAAIARRRRLLSDDVLISLTKSFCDWWGFLDISGSDVTDSGLSTVAKKCTNLRAVDISRCEKVTVAGVSELLSHCRSLEILRCGGCSRSNSTARECLSILNPELSLRWLVWPKIDGNSKITLAEECPRIIVNPQPYAIGFHGVQVPAEALPDVALDHSAVEDINPKTWAVSEEEQPPSSSDDAPPETCIVKRCRVAILEREARPAPKGLRKLSSRRCVPRGSI